MAHCPFQASLYVVPFECLSSCRFEMSVFFILCLVCLSVCLIFFSISMSIFLISLSVYLIFLSILMPVYRICCPFVCLSILPDFHLSVCMSTVPVECLSVFLPLDVYSECTSVYIICSWFVSYSNFCPF
jgi:hypothetical protein